MGIDEVGRPLEVAGLDVFRGEGQFKSVGGHAGYVTVLGQFAADALGVGEGDQVEVVTLVPVTGEVDAVVHKTQFQTHVELMLLFEGEVGVGQAADIQAGLDVAGVVPPGVVGLDDGVGVGDRRGTAFCRQGVGELEGGVGEGGLEAGHPRLVADIPSARYVPGRKPTGAAGLAQAVGAFVTDGSVDAVTVLETVGEGAEESLAAFVGVVHAEVVGVLFRTLLEYLIIGDGNLAHVVLQAPAAEPLAVTVNGVHLHTAVGADGVDAVESLVVAQGNAGVPSVHGVVVGLIDTTVRKDGLGKGEGDIRVRVQQRVVIADDGGVGCTVGLGLVGTVRDMVLAGGGSIFGGDQAGSLQVFGDLPLEFSLETQVGHVQVEVVVLQLVDDVERSVVTGVVNIRIQGAGSVQCVGIRVDIELARYLAAHAVHLRREGTGSALLTVGGVADHVQGQVVRDLERGVHVEGVAADGALKRPAFIVHDGHGSVVVGLVRTTGHGNGVGVLDRVAEQQVEPVRVAELGGS